MNRHTISAMIIGIAVIVFFMFVMPVFDDLSGLRKTLASRKELLAITQATEANIKKLDAEFKANQDITKQVEIAIPEKKQIDYITNSFQMAATAAGMQLTTITISEATKAEAEYQSFQVKVDLTGTYPGFLIFLDSLERSLRIYDVNRLTISVPANGLSQFTVQIITYSIK